MDALRGARTLVTGAPGFIGSHLTRRLVREGAEVYALSPDVSSVYPVRLTDLRNDIHIESANVADRSALDSIVQRIRPEYVFHLAAFTHVSKSWDRVDECVQGNVQGTVNLLYALKGEFRRFLFVGTSEIYGDINVPFREDAQVNPVSPYALTKYAAEQFCRIFHGSYDWPIVMVRPFNAYGPAQTPDRIIAETIIRGLLRQELKMTKGLQTREFNYVEDLVDGMIRAATTPGVEGELFNIGCGEEISMRDIVTLILDLMGNPIEPEFGALPDRLIEIWRMYCDSTKARQRLGWAPGHTLRQGLEKTIEWYSGEIKRPDSQFWVSGPEAHSKIQIGG